MSDCRLLIATVLILGSLAFAQSKATVEGTIRDSQGHPIREATVELKPVNAEASINHADAQGQYRFASLHAGEYTVRAEWTGKAPVSFGPFTLQDNEARTIDLTLPKPAAEFFDEPNFTVAGVTDTVNRGGHGSDTVIRSTEAIAKAAASLGKQPAVEPGTEQFLRDSIARDPSDASAHHSLADLEEHRGNSLDAVREYQRASGLDPSETNLFDWGSELLTHRAADQSIEVFGKGNRTFPRSSRMLLGLGAALYARGAYDEAARRFFEAADINPNDPAPYLFLGTVQNSEINTQDGFLERMARFAKLEPSNARANYLYAAALWRHSNDPEDRPAVAKVEGLLEKALAIDPTLADAYLLLGILHSTLLNFPKAIVDYLKAIETGSQSEEVHYRLAQAYQRTGQALKASQEFEIYNQLSKTSAEKAERERHSVQQFVFDMRTRQ